MTSKMKQIRMDHYGASDVLKWVEVEKPQPKTGEVLIKVSAIGVNYSDILRRQNTYFMPTPLPFVLGTEAVGVIESVGTDVAETFAIGTRVLAILPAGGGYAEYVAAEAHYCVPLPPTIDDKAATAIFVQGSTAQLMITQLAGNIANKTILITASAGGVGSLLVQLAKQNGAYVIGASSSDEKLTTVQALGADAVVNYAKPTWGDDLKRITGDKGVDIVFETVGGELYNESVKSLAAGGQIIVYGCASGVQGSIHPEYFVDKNLSQSGFNLAFFIQRKTQIWQAELGTLIGLIAEGKLKIETTELFSLKDAAKAHQQIEARKTVGKVVLLP